MGGVVVIGDFDVIFILLSFTPNIQVIVHQYVHGAFEAV